MPNFKNTKKVIPFANLQHTEWTVLKSIDSINQFEKEKKVNK